eukprot:TRINITY_DN1129_c0_g1_i1.p1 TRINITY_DN1129_c0_g1~~TRINITY_DN1129_c0_g1_i1.p1  ORF type:complete len:858 (-),score=231.64 TRINITY_DN1129_c0_g1_i1:47-2620(-)
MGDRGTALVKGLFGKTSSQTLGKPEQKHFETLYRSIEQKRWAEGLKNVNKVLKVSPDHGESLAVKALLIRMKDFASADVKKTSYELVNLGIRKDIRSYLCWHIYALLLRADREYEKALSAFRQAVKDRKRFEGHKEELMTLLREIAVLESQTRNFKGLLETRRELLLDDPAKLPNWISFALANYLVGDYDQTIDVLDKFQNRLIHDEFETSEVLVFRVIAFMKAKKWQSALEALAQNEQRILDKTQLHEFAAQAHLELKHYAEAQKSYLKLLSINPDNNTYHEGLEKSVQNDKQQLLTIYRSLNQSTGNGGGLWELVYMSADDEPDFSEKLYKYLLPKLESARPSLYLQTLPIMQSDPKKADKILQVISRILKESEDKVPTAELSSYLYLSNFYSVENPKLALEYNQKGLEHTPTYINMYISKAMILRHAGADQEASQVLDKARRLDLADRWLNTKSARYWLRSGDLEEADKVVFLFLKGEKEVPPPAAEGTDSTGESSVSEIVKGPQEKEKEELAKKIKEEEEEESKAEKQFTGKSDNLLNDMQANWYEWEQFKCFYYKHNSPHQALKVLKRMEKHFDDFVEDQYDFHIYCIRKVTLKSYIDMIASLDNIYSHRFYLKLATGYCVLWSHFFDQFAQKNPGFTWEKRSQFNMFQERIPVDKHINRVKDMNEGLGIAGLIKIAEVYLRQHKFLLALQCCTRSLSVFGSNQTVFMKGGRTRQLRVKYDLDDLVEFVSRLEKEYERASKEETLATEVKAETEAGFKTLREQLSEAVKVRGDRTVYGEKREGEREVRNARREVERLGKDIGEDRKKVLKERFEHADLFGERVKEVEKEEKGGEEEGAPAPGGEVTANSKEN